MLIRPTPLQLFYLGLLISGLSACTAASPSSTTVSNNPAQITSTSPSDPRTTFWFNGEPGIDEIDVAIAFALSQGVNPDNPEQLEEIADYIETVLTIEASREEILDRLQFTSNPLPLAQFDDDPDNIPGTVVDAAVAFARFQNAQELGLADPEVVIQFIDEDLEIPVMIDPMSELPDQNSTPPPVPTPTPTGSPLPTPTPTGSPLPTPTPTGSATPTPTPTGSPTPTPTPTATPIPTPTPTILPTPPPGSIVVNTLDDEDDTDPSECSLREAIQATNDSTAIGGCPAGNGFIQFDPSLAGGTISLTDSLPDVNADVTIDGSAADPIEINGNETHQVLEIANPDAVVSLNHLIIADGLPSIGVDGGGILNRGTLTINNCTFDTNEAVQAQGGAIYSVGNTLTIQNSRFSGNRALNGGAIYLLSGDAMVTDSVFASNTAAGGMGGSGGGIAAISSTLTVINSTLRNGSASNQGGAILNGFSDVEIRNSTLSNNRANRGGGGLFTSTLSDTLLINSTVSGNSTTDQGGGIYNDDSIMLIHSTLSGNTAGDTGGGIYTNQADDTVLDNTLVVNSIGGNCSGPATEVVNSSLFDDVTCDGVETPNAEQIGPLSNNGGSTETHLLLLGHPGINTGNNDLAVDATGNPLTTDQRGPDFARILGPTVDIGSVEVQ